MKRAELLGDVEMVVADRAVSGCMTWAAPLVFVAAGYYVKASWAVVRGAARPVIADSEALNLAAGLGLLGTALFFCVAALLVFVGGVWRTRLKLRERGLTLHGVESLGRRSQFLYREIASVRVTEKHHTRDAPQPRGWHRDLFDVAADALSRTERVRPRQVYVNTQYTFSLTLKGEAEPFEFSLTLDRARREVEAVAARLAAKRVGVARDMES